MAGAVEANRAGTGPREFRLLYQDLGVAAVVLAALLLALLLRAQAEGRTVAFQEEGGGVRLSYPVGWIVTDSLQPNSVLRVEDPRTASTYKTNVQIERRDLDPASPPTLQTLVDRQIAQRQVLPAYHLLGSSETTIDGARVAQLDYAYAVQPIDAPRNASLPVVVQARELIVVGRDRSYMLTLTAPGTEAAAAAGVFDQIVRSVRFQ